MASEEEKTVFLSRSGNFEILNTSRAVGYSVSDNSKVVRYRMQKCLYETALLSDVAGLMTMC